MPQASDELRAKFPGDDQQAFKDISEHFAVNRGGIIYPKIVGEAFVAKLGYNKTRRDHTNAARLSQGGKKF